MDTRFWGPSGWKLLHLVASDQATSSSKASTHSKEVPAFFETLPYILPCKFCRASLTDYFREHPLPSSPSAMESWMYTIHNCVNQKLKSQGLPVAAAPSLAHVKQRYRALLRCGDNGPSTLLPLLWDFFFSVGYHHPTQRTFYAKPMPECPKDITRRSMNADACEKNKWNVLPLAQRVQWFRRFWSLLPAVLPPSIRTHWNRALRRHPPTLKTQTSTLNWLWRMRCTLQHDYSDPYSTICRQIAQYSSDCGTRRGAFTCRRKKNPTHRKTRKK